MDVMQWMFFRPPIDISRPSARVFEHGKQANGRPPRARSARRNSSTLSTGANIDPLLAPGAADLAFAAMSRQIGLSEDQLWALVGRIKDWQINHGSLIKLVKYDEENTVPSLPIGVSLKPTPFPREYFDQAFKLQRIYNELYVRISQSPDWLFEALRGLIEVDPFTRSLWQIHESVRNEGYVQDIHLGVFRSDYMLHDMRSMQLNQQWCLKQVEFNTFSCAGGAHAEKVANMHRYLTLSDQYQNQATYENYTGNLSALPRNSTIKTIAEGLAEAHNVYVNNHTTGNVPCGVLFIVQPQNVNVCDERPIEYELWNREHPIPSFRVEWGRDVLDTTYLTPTRQLMYSPVSSDKGALLEVSVVYMRAGYDPAEYDAVGCECRLQLETSRAIKCPSVLSHLATFKKVQQALANPGVLERFLPLQDALAVRETFMPMYPLDKSETGLRGRELATNVHTAKNYVLKPSLEGGGHNVYGEDIPDFLKKTPEWERFILQEMIRPPSLYNVLMSQQGLESGAVVSELGIFGISLWQQMRSEEHAQSSRDLGYGWSYKTKFKEIKEMSVIKGYGCFDCPFLMNGLAFTNLCSPAM